MSDDGTYVQSGDDYEDNYYDRHGTTRPPYFTTPQWEDMGRNFRLSIGPAYQAWIREDRDRLQRGIPRVPPPASSIAPDSHSVAAAVQ